MFRYQRGKFGEQPVAFIESVLTVEVADADQIEVHHDGVPALFAKPLFFSLRKIEEVSHLRKLRQRVCIDPVIEVFDVLADTVSHLDERTVQHTDLIVSVVIEFHIIIACRKTLRGRGEVAYRLRDPPDCIQHKTGEEHQYRRCRDQQYLEHVPPRSVDLPRRRSYGQHHAAGKRRVRHLAPLAARGIADQFIAVAPLPELLFRECLSVIIGLLSRFVIRMIDNAALIVEEAGKSRLVYLYIAELGREGIHGYVKPDDSYQSSGVVDRYRI